MKSGGNRCLAWIRLAILLGSVSLGASLASPSPSTSSPSSAAGAVIERTSASSTMAKIGPSNSTKFSVESSASGNDPDATSTIISNRLSREVAVEGLFPTSPLPGANSRGSSGRDPTAFNKLVRRCTVFWVAFRVFAEYKLAGRAARRLKTRLGLSVEDPDGDDHPDVVALWGKVHARNAARLLRQIKDLAGFWVKVGQYLSTRADVLPPEYLTSLAELQDSMPPKRFDDVLATLREEFDDEALASIQSIDPRPLSTASLAQVHRATLRKGHPKDAPGAAKGKDDGGREVVLKVQHRGVASLMLQDMDNLRVVLELLARTDPDLDFGSVIREYSAEVEKELDFRTEARNMREVGDLLRAHDLRAIVPDAVPGLVKERVLVMDFCEGFPIKDTDSMDRHGVDRELLLERVCKAWAIQMHVGGLFNADPHGGNILVSTAVPGDASVPVLLDFGLTKRLNPPIKLAFARLMHSSYEGDIDGLIRSFREMGLKMNRHDPMEDMVAMQRGFGDTVPRTRAREVRKKKGADYRRRNEAQRAEAGLKKGDKLRNPVEAWPSELVFFGRVTNMLRGLCSQMDVSYPYLKTMAAAAKETVKASVPLEEHARSSVHHSSNTVSTDLQRRLLNILPLLEREGQVVGLQLCVLKDGEEIANIAAGTLGVANPRPVMSSTLFNIFSVSKGALAVCALRLVQDGSIGSLDDPVCKYWPAFSTKPNITVRHLLTHQAGLSNVYPEDATLDTLLDWSTMTTFMAEHAEPSHEPGEETQYHALTYAWLVGGLIEQLTGRPYEELFEDLLSTAMRGNEQRLFLAGISKDVDDDRDLAVLSLDRSGNSQQKRDEKKNPPEKVETVASSGGQEENKEETQTNKKQSLAKYRGLQQLMNPTVFNMRKVREAKLPSANGHASASSLAHFFHAVIRPNDPILTPDILAKARTPHRSASGSSEKNAMLNDSQSLFGLGFQLHDFVVSDGNTVTSIGHSGIGGSLVLAVPEENAVIALTLNHLSGDSVARQRLLGIVFDELGWQPPPSIPVQQPVAH